MSRYDGLIIPRSYNEYINKSDPLTLAQALQQNNVLSAAVAAGDNKAVKSGAVATALAKYGKIYKDLESLNADKGTAIELVNGEDNCSKIVEVLNPNEVFSDYFNNSTSNSTWGIGSSSGTSYVLIRFEKLGSNYCIISAYETDTNTEYFRVSKGGTLGAWQINAKKSELQYYLNNFPKSAVTDCNEAPVGLYCNRNVSNAPENSTGYIYLFTLSFDNNAYYRIQFCFLISNTNIYRRVKIQGTWGQWSAI